MSWNEFIRKAYELIFFPKTPRWMKRVGDFFNLIKMVWNSLIKSLGFIISTTLKILLWLAGVSFIPTWIKALSALWIIFQSAPDINDDPIATKQVFIVILGSFVVYFVLKPMLQPFTDYLGGWINDVIYKMRRTRVYSSINEWIFKISKIYFETVLLPNIDRIEPGIDGQNTEAFPHQIIYKDNNARLSDHISMISDGNWGNAQMISSLSGFAVCLFLTIFFGILSSLLNTLSPTLSNILDFFINNVLVLALIPSSIIALVSIHPSGIISIRRQVLEVESYLLTNEENLKEKIAGVEQDIKWIDISYNQKISEIKAIIEKQDQRLTEVQKEALLTQQNFEEVRKLITTKPEIVTLLWNEFQESQEEREKKKYWKDKAVDIGIGIIVGIITGFLLGQ